LEESVRGGIWERRRVNTEGTKEEYRGHREAKSAGRQDAGATQAASSEVKRSRRGVRENKGARLRRRPLQLVARRMSPDLDKKARYQQSDSASVKSPH